MEDQTLERCRTEFWQPKVSDRTGLDEWLQEGKPDTVVRARERWQQLIAAHQDPPLDGITARQLKAFLEEESN
jgi:trimethylamine:corrinoid methyltransferase-like protein